MQSGSVFQTCPIPSFNGYADTAVLEDARGNSPLLRKPFKPVELATAIRALLGQTDAAS